MAVPDPPLDFPPLFDFDADRWQWPAPPFAWRHEPAPDTDVAQACRLEMATGDTVEGAMLGFDAVARSLLFRSAVNGLQVTLPFDQFRRLSLALPLRPVIGNNDRPLDPLPEAEHGCAYVLEPHGGGATLSGHTVGHLERPEGLFLFAPIDDESALLRVFAPKGPNARAIFEPTAMEIAARDWADTPALLLDAVAQQRHRPVLQLGRSILALALLTPQQLEGALARQPDNLPMGEFLVSVGLISRPELEAAIAHKMGCPIVNLPRFPIDPDAVSRLPQRLAMAYRVLPLMLDGNRLLLASDQPLSEDKQRSIQVFTNLGVVPVLTRKDHLRAAMAEVPSNAWSARAI